MKRLFIHTRLFNSIPFVVKLIAAIARVAMVTAAFTSCSTVRKSQTSHRETVDSVQVKKVDSVQVKKVDTSTVTKFNFSTTKDSSKKTDREIIIEVDTGYHSDYPPKPEDYDTAAGRGIKEGKSKTKFKPIVVTWPVTGTGPVTIDLGNWKPLRIITREHTEQTGSDSTGILIIDSTGRKTSDSAAVSTTDSTAVQKDTVDKSSSKKKTGFPFAVIVIAALVCFLLYFLDRRSR